MFPGPRMAQSFVVAGLSSPVGIFWSALRTLILNLKTGKYGPSYLGTSKRRGGGVVVSGASWGEEGTEVSLAQCCVNSLVGEAESNGEHVGHSYAITITRSP